MLKLTLSVLLVAALGLCIVSASQKAPNACASSAYGNVVNPAPSADIVGPDEWIMTLETDVVDDNGDAMGPIVINIIREYAPIGSDRLFSLMLDRYYQNAPFFRVVPDFMTQFGIAANPHETAKWNTNIPDDPVFMQNTVGMVSFATAGQNSRTSQIFINTGDNTFLDDTGFSPVGHITEDSWDTLDRIFNPTPRDDGGADQGRLTDKGNDWMLNRYPDTNIITCTHYTITKVGGYSGTDQAGVLGASSIVPGEQVSSSSSSGGKSSSILGWVLLFIFVALLVMRGVLQCAAAEDGLGSWLLGGGDNGRGEKRTVRFSGRGYGA